MKNGYFPIVCISGSMNFYEQMLETASRLTLQGKIVLMPFFTKGDVTPAQARKLDALHIRKIAISDELYVVNFQGYIGESTRKEITYAEAHHIPITYLAELKEESEEQA